MDIIVLSTTKKKEERCEKHMILQQCDESFLKNIAGWSAVNIRIITMKLQIERQNPRTPSKSKKTRGEPDEHLDQEPE